MRRTVLFVAVALFTLFGAGCDDDCEQSRSFTPSDTVVTPNLVKLVQKHTAANELVIQVVIYGPTTSTDLYSFTFDLVTGDRDILHDLDGSPVVGDALTASGAQSVSATAGTDAVDPTHFRVRVSKQGGGGGNQVTGESATIVELRPLFLSDGAVTLTIAASPTPVATDANGAVIGSVIFDAGVSVASTSTRGDCFNAW